MVDMFGLFLRLMMFVLLMKINKGLLLLKNRTNLRRFGSILILIAKIRAFPKKAKIKASLGQLGLVTVLD